MWVRSEYAGELAVLSAWLCALLPWSVGYASQITLFRIHFLYVLFQFSPGSEFSSVVDNYKLATGAPSFASNQSVSFGYRLWVLGTGVLTLAIALSVVYYCYDERLEQRSPVDPVRLMGGLLVAAAVPFTVATYFVASGSIGLTIPIGVVFMYALGGLLLVVERTPSTPDATADRPESV